MQDTLTIARERDEMKTLATAVIDQKTSKTAAVDAIGQSVERLTLFLLALAAAHPRYAISFLFTFADERKLSDGEGVGP